MTHKRFSEKEFKKIYSKVPRATVSLVVKTKKGIVLSLRDLPSWRNQWHLPGGSISYQETIKDAICRKAKEELGIKVKIIKLLGCMEYPSEIKERGFGWSIDLIFLCKYDGTKFKLNDEASKIDIFKKLPRNTISEQTKFLKKHWKEIN